VCKTIYTRSLIKIALLTWSVYNANRRTTHSVLSKTQKTDCNQFSRSKVIDCVGELLTRRWNAWYSERHYVFTTGGERVNEIINDVT
jgi:hypothetical protein